MTDSTPLSVQLDISGETVQLEMPVTPISIDIEHPLSSKKAKKSKKAVAIDPHFYIETPMPSKKASRKKNKMSEKDLLNEYLENEWIESVESPGPTVVFPSSKEKLQSSVKSTSSAKSNHVKTDVSSGSHAVASTTAKKESKKGKKGKQQEKDDHFVRPKSKNQEDFVQLLKTKANKIVVVTGPAGTGKTMLATEHGIQAFLGGEYDKMIFTRPSVSVDEDLGFLPGTLEEKMAPWIRPIYDVLYEHISPKEIEYLIDEKIMEIAPLGFMRGRTFKNAWIVADEMQNSTPSQMKMLLTRLGENSRLIVTGDLEQYDRVAGGGINGLEDFLRRFRGTQTAGEEPTRRSICAFEFKRSDIQREEVVKEVLSIYG
jgi:phosphate starvation-inducible PhoH-like protein